MRSSAIVILGILLPACAADQLPSPRFADLNRKARLRAALPEVEKVFERFWKQRGAPGLVYGVVIDGEPVVIKNFGVREQTANDPVTPDTVFRIASMTKSFTALAVLKLRDEGKLSLDDPVSKWIPEFARMPLPTTDSAPLRIRQLLTHGGGFPEDNPWGDRQLGIDDNTLTRWLRAGLPFSTPPDTAYEYSNYGFALAGRIVSMASGRPYREYLEKQILAPLGMTASTLEPSAVPSGIRATGYGKPGQEYVEEPSLPHGAFGSMGGLLTSARDMAKYVAFHLSAFPPRDEPEKGPVRRSSVREMQRLWRTSRFSVDRSAPGEPIEATAGGYGYGLSVSQDCRFRHIVGHGGGLPGFGSYMMWLPDHGAGVFAMANLTYAGLSGACSEAFDALRNTGALQPRELLPSPALVSARDAIVRLWTDWDTRDASALAAYNLFLDRSAEVRRKEIEKLKAEMGVCRPSGEISPENLLRGSFRLACDHGFVRVSFTLAPTVPPKVQYLRFSTQSNPGPATVAAVQAIAAFSASPVDERLAAVAAPSLNVAGLRKQMEALQVLYGSCRVGEALEGDGTRSQRIRLECDRAPVDARITLDGAGKLGAVTFARPPDAVCVP